MPVVRIGQEAFSLLVSEARDLEISVSALVTTVVLGYFAEDQEEEEDEDVDEDEDEDDDVEGPDVIGDLLGGDDDVDED